MNLKEELTKARDAFEKLPLWRQYALRNSMKGYVSVPRKPIKRKDKDDPQN